MFVGGLALVGAMVGFVVADTGGRPEGDAAPVETTTTTTLPPASSTTSTTVAEPVTVAFQATVDRLAILEQPNGASRWELGNPGPFDGTLTLQATGNEVDGFSEVVVPVKPNGTRGWVRTDEVVPVVPSTSIVVDLSDRVARLIVDGEELLSAPVAIGRPRTPTPELFAIVDHVEQRANPNGTYGSWLFGLNQHSEVLDTFEGGRPAIAIHGTNEPELIGGEVSNGCVRMHNEDIERFAEHVELGTLVAIVG